MPRAGTLLEASIAFFSELGNNAVEPLRLTQEELRTNQFSIEKTIGRGLSLWLDATEGLLSSVLVTANGPLPTVFLRVTPDASTVGQTVNMRIPTTTPLSRTTLRQIGGDAYIDDDRFVTDSSSLKNALKVKLVDLKDHRPAPGLYESLVYGGDKPVAVVMVQVEARASRTRRKR